MYVITEQIKQLCERIQSEPDGHKVLALVEQLHQLLSEQEARSKKRMEKATA